MSPNNAGIANYRQRQLNSILMEKQLWLIRHTEVENAGYQHFYGFHDIDLSVQGIKQVEQLTAFLGQQNLARIISTGLKRTDHLARMLEQKTNISWEVDPSLKEMHFGRWEGLSAKEVEEAEPELYAKCVGADMNFRFPEGESVLEFLERVKTGLQKIILSSNDSVIAIITHSGVIRMALKNILDLDFQNYWRFRIDYGSITVFDIYGDYTCIRKINDTCHLNGFRHKF